MGQSPWWNNVNTLNLFECTIYTMNCQVPLCTTYIIPGPRTYSKPVCQGVALTYSCCCHSANQLHQFA